jgi:outer membrane lipoprotein-sorting protein
MDSRILLDAYAAMPSPEAPAEHPGPHMLRRIFMRNTLKLTAAAVVTIAVSLLFLFNTSSTNIVWAEVAAKTDSINDFVYQSQENRVAGKNYPESITSTIYTSADYGIRIDAEKSGNMTFTLPAEKTITVVMPSIRKYKQHPLSDDAIAEMKENSPKTLVKKYIAAKYKSLGSKMINGIEAEGIEVNDIELVKSNRPIKSYLGRLWIDVQTELPILLEAELVLSQGENDIQVKVILDNFQWNVDLKPEIFKPNIPKDYTEL